MTDLNESDSLLHKSVAVVGGGPAERKSAIGGEILIAVLKVICGLVLVWLAYKSLTMQGLGADSFEATFGSMKVKIAKPIAAVVFAVCGTIVLWSARIDITFDAKVSRKKKANSK
jgi:hypothetical protein